MKTILVNPKDLHPAIFSSPTLTTLINIEEEDEYIMIPKDYYFENFENLSEKNF